MDELAGLFLNGGDNLGMAMAGGADGDAGGEVHEHVAVHVFDHRAAPALGDQRVIARVRRRHELGVSFEDALGVRSGSSVTSLGSFQSDFDGAVARDFVLDSDAVIISSSLKKMVNG